VGTQGDGNVPLHEWVERDANAVDEDFARHGTEDAAQRLRMTHAGRIRRKLSLAELGIAQVPDSLAAGETCPLRNDES